MASKKTVGRPKLDSKYAGKVAILTYVSPELKTEIIKKGAELATKIGKPMSIADTVRTLLGDMLLGNQTLEE